ncbi:MAG: hypothetical protein ACUVSV_06935 [Armatimonadota bacterium]
MQLWLRLCLRLWAIAMGVFLLSGPRVYAVNLIVNGDFEAGNTASPRTTPMTARRL